MGAGNDGGDGAQEGICSAGEPCVPTVRGG